ncbi:MAG: hypothetical protein BWX46_00613 [Candidatus Cloacimonetes bacterium ADurb.Bin003]|nr:MAG: hypothetical protein BWX46_00613 [Candidatus Cloacimonetes bacterium ADurb.Bin003]
MTKTQGRCLAKAEGSFSLAVVLALGIVLDVLLIFCLIF